MGDEGERSSVGDVLVTAWCVRPFIKAGHSRQGHSDLQPWSKLVGTLSRNQLSRTKLLLQIQSIILRHY